MLPTAALSGTAGGFCLMGDGSRQSGGMRGQDNEERSRHQGADAQALPDMSPNQKEGDAG